MNRLSSYTTLPPLAPYPIRIRRIVPTYPAASRPTVLGNALIIAIAATSVWAVVAVQVAIAMAIVVRS